MIRQTEFQRISYQASMPLQMFIQKSNEQIDDFSEKSKATLTPLPNQKMQIGLAFNANSSRGNDPFTLGMKLTMMGNSSARLEMYTGNDDGQIGRPYFQQSQIIRSRFKNSHKHQQQVQQQGLRPLDFNADWYRRRNQYKKKQQRINSQYDNFKKCGRLWQNQLSKQLRSKVVGPLIQQSQHHKRYNAKRNVATSKHTD